MSNRVGRRGNELVPSVQASEVKKHPPVRKGDQAYIEVGAFACHITKHGLVSNPPLITRWGKKCVGEYIKFLEELLPYLGDCGECSGCEGWGYGNIPLKKEKTDAQK